MIPFADLHCDTAARLVEIGADLHSDRLHVNLEKLQKYSRAAQVFAICTEPACRGGERFTRAVEIARQFHRNISENAGKIRLCRSFDEIEAAANANAVAALLSVEGGGALDGKLENLDVFFDLGVRIVTLTWNGENELALGQPSHGGLTQFGRRVLDRMRRLGMVPDLSHMSVESFSDVCEHDDGELFCSHSNFSAVHPHGRNLEDWQAREVFRRGGVVGLNFYPPFLTDGPAAAADVIPHLEHALLLGGKKQVCLGCDFDGVDRLPDGMTGLESMEEIYAMLSREGYPDALLADLFYNNALAFFKRVLG